MRLSSRSNHVRHCRNASRIGSGRIRHRDRSLRSRSDPLRPPADTHREDPAQPLGRPHRRDRTRRHLQRLPPRPRGDAGRHRADGTAAVHDRRPADHGRAEHRALRPPDLGQGRRSNRSRRGDRHQQGGVRLPSIGQRQVRHRLLGSRQRHHPPGRPRELRLPRRDDDRHRQPHAQRGWARHGRDRGRRRRRGRCDDRLSVQRPLAEGDRCEAHRHA